MAAFLDRLEGRAPAVGAAATIARFGWLFAAAVAAMMIGTSLLVGLARESLVGRLQASAVWIKRASGVVLIAAGLYLGCPDS